MLRDTTARLSRNNGAFFFICCVKWPCVLETAGLLKHWSATHRIRVTEVTTKHKVKATTAINEPAHWYVNSDDLSRTHARTLPTVFMLLHVSAGVHVCPGKINTRSWCQSHYRIISLHSPYYGFRIFRSTLPLNCSLAPCRNSPFIITQCCGLWMMRIWRSNICGSPNVPPMSRGSCHNALLSSK